MATQQGLVPGLTVLSYACVDIAGTAVTGTCQPGDWVRVTVRSRIYPVTPALSFLGQIDLTATSSAQIE